MQAGDSDKERAKKERASLDRLKDRLEGDLERRSFAVGEHQDCGIFISVNIRLPGGAQGVAGGDGEQPDGASEEDGRKTGQES